MVWQHMFSLVWCKTHHVAFVLRKYSAVFPKATLYIYMFLLIFKFIIYNVYQLFIKLQSHGKMKENKLKKDA